MATTLRKKLLRSRVFFVFLVLMDQYLHLKETGKWLLSGCFCPPKQAAHFAACLPPLSTYLSGWSKHSPVGKHMESGSKVVLTLWLCEAALCFPFKVHQRENGERESCTQPKRAVCSSQTFYSWTPWTHKNHTWSEWHLHSIGIKRHL